MKLIPLLSLICAVGFLFSGVAGAKIECIESSNSTGSSKAVVVDAVPLAHTGLVFAFDRHNKLMGSGDVAKQATQVLANLDAVLKRGKSSLGQTVKLNVYLPRAELKDRVSEVLAKQFYESVKPAVTFVGGELIYPDALVAMDAVAVSKWQIKGSAPVHIKAKGVKFSEVSILPPTGTVYVAGLAAKGDPVAATRETMAKIESAITHLGLKRGDIVQLKAFLLPMSRAEEVRAEIATYFGEETVPPIVFVDWISSSVPVEIEAIVAAPVSESGQTITFHTPEGTTASPVYSRLARIHSGKRIYISNLYGRQDKEQDVKDIFAQLDYLLEQTGSSRDHLAKATYYYSDPQSNGRLDAFRPTYYNPKTPPTASKVRVKEVGEPGRGISIDIIGVTK